MKKNRVLVIAMACMSLVAVNVAAQRSETPDPKNPEGKPCPQECPQMCPMGEHPGAPGKRAERPAEVFSPETRAMMRADRMAAELELKDDVKQKLVDLFTKEEKAREQQRAEMEKQRAKEREALNAEMEKIIGAENMQKLQQKCEKKAPAHPARHENCPKKNQEKAPEEAK